MTSKTIRAVLSKKLAALVESITDPAVADLVRKNTIVTGGSIASMLLREDVNDFDVYFTNLETTEAVARYYVAKFTENTGYEIKVDVAEGRVRIVTQSGHRGETAGNIEALTDSGEIEDTYEKANEAALATESDGKPKYRPVFMSTNAITLSDKVQVVLRFYGEPDEIHENYDFVHCTNYWRAKNDELVLRPAALEALLSKELRYVGSKYPVCSVMRLRKFIGRDGLDGYDFLQGLDTGFSFRQRLLGDLRLEDGRRQRCRDRQRRGVG